MTANSYVCRSQTEKLVGEQGGGGGFLPKLLEESGLLIRDVSKTIKNEAKDQKVGFLSLLLGTLGASL